MDEDGPYDKLDLRQMDDDTYTVVPARRDRRVLSSVDTDEEHGHHHHDSLIDPRQVDEPTYANIERKEEEDPSKKTLHPGDQHDPHGVLDVGQMGDATFIPMVNIEPKKEEEEEEDPPKIVQSGSPGIRRYQWVGVGLLCAVLALLNVAVPVYLYQTNMLERERLVNQLLDSNNQLTAERNQSRDTIDNLTTQRDQLRDTISNLTAEGIQSQHRISNLTVERDCLKRRLCESDGFTLRDGLCYFISTEKKSWVESRQWCRDNHSDLMVIKSKEKQDFVASFNKRVWLGLSDSAVEGSFQWVDGTPLTQPEFWFQGAPDATCNEPEPGCYPNAEEDCVEYYDGSHSNSNATGWNDLRCNKHLTYWICEKPLC